MFAVCANGSPVNLQAWHRSWSAKRNLNRPTKFRYDYELSTIFK